MSSGSPPTSGKTFTGRVRDRRTTWRVRAGDGLAKACITVGGTGTIVAVCGVCLFLLWVALPLFRSARIAEPRTVEVAWGKAPPAAFDIDEYGLLGTAVDSAGTLHVFRVDTGAALAARPLTGGAVPTATAFASGDRSAAFGFDDGRVRVGRIGFRSAVREEDELPAEIVAAVDRDGAAVHEEGLVDRTPLGQLRQHEAAVSEFDEFPLEGGRIVALDVLPRPDGPVIAAVSADGTLRVGEVVRTEDLLTFETTVALGRTAELKLPGGSDAPPAKVLLDARGNQVFVCRSDGRMLRCNVRDREAPFVAEEVDLIPAPAARLTAARMLLGGETLLAGDSEGGLSAWFLVRPKEAATKDGAVLVEGHRFPAAGAAVESLGISQRSRLVAAGLSDGRLRVAHVTTDRLLLDLPGVASGPLGAVTIGTRDDALHAASASGLWSAKLDPAHPEASLASLFRPVWYEGYEQPLHFWQSTAATESVEPKLGMLPLVFGTAKATFYSLLFAVPLALLAAVCTSEFLRPAVRARIKPTIELMASLPSVVLGFLAAIVFAPLAERLIPAVVAAIATIPLALLLAAHLWQLLPLQTAIRHERLRFGLQCLAVPCGIAAAVVAGPRVEGWLYGGNFVRWLDGETGTATGGWLFLLLPLSGLAAVWFVQGVVGPWLSARCGHWERRRFALLDLGKFAVVAAGTLGFALGISWMLSAAGFDPRGTWIDTYVQRNALVVGFVMGFAVVPIIYTLADDALSAVPEHLRSASLGCGATPLQTALRIVVPTAMSGLFSAVMVGLGRCVGETMIVLMAGGNTPVMKWNVFEGFRTLSACLAVELPEAARGSTHFRTLFLAGLTLFALTFVVNTVAEVVRIRFRRRAFQL